MIAKKSFCSRNHQDLLLPILTKIKERGQENFRYPLEVDNHDNSTGVWLYGHPDTCPCLFEIQPALSNAFPWWKRKVLLLAVHIELTGACFERKEIKTTLRSEVIHPFAIEELKDFARTNNATLYINNECVN